MIFDISIYNLIVNFDMLNDHEPEFNHKPLNVTLNVVMPKIPIMMTKITYLNQNKVICLKDLDNELNILSNKDNLKDLYDNFKTTLPTSIYKFSIKVLCEKKNRMTNPCMIKSGGLLENPLGMFLMSH
jgi:hypothetical protein